MIRDDEAQSLVEVRRREEKRAGPKRRDGDAGHDEVAITGRQLLCEARAVYWQELQAHVQLGRQAVVERFKALGYLYVTLDLAGFRSGSMNDVLRGKEQGT